ncbi:hypothetical protein, partial [Winogradskyella poriferorum]|uniref:hypothetical protein n=1 Tax=Winogradskyella poriferorum TaxID=307627 RepID=UPI003D65294A
ICPWHSKKRKPLKKISPELNTYIRENVFDIISKAIHCSAIKTVLSVGKTYHDLFGLESLGFKKLIDVTSENYLN